MVTDPGIAFEATSTNALIVESATSISLKTTDWLFDVTVFVANRFCPAMITGMVCPMKKTFGCML